MNDTTATRPTGMSLLLVDALSAIAGLALVGSTFMTTFVVDVRGGRFVVPPGGPHSCTAWIPCPGNEFTPDYSGAIGWVALVAAVVTIGLPVSRVLTGQPISRPAARWQLFVCGVLLAAMAAAAGLTLFHPRVAGYQEWNYQFYLQPTGGTAVMFVAMLVGLLSAVLVEDRATTAR